jgi:transcriptional regulator with XRE-family HTH domain
MIRKISSAQIRAARALLRWTALDLAKASKVGVATIRRVEVIDGEISATLANEAALRGALETAGVEFIDENGGGAGVRLRKPTVKGSKKIKNRLL